MSRTRAGSTASRRRQRLVAFKPHGGLAAPQAATGQQLELQHDAETNVPCVTAGSGAGTTGADLPGTQGHAGVPIGSWSRSEAARLLTEAILLDWTTPWPSGSGDRRTGSGRGSWAAAAGVRSRVAETTARLGTDWLSAAAGHASFRPSVPPSDTAAAEVGNAIAHAQSAPGQEIIDKLEVPGHAGSVSSATGEVQQQHNARNAGRLVVPRETLMAWLGSKPARAAA